MPAASARISTASPNVQVLTEAFTIPGLNRPRTIRLYLPPGYAQSQQRYPVLYLHDGQNLFDEATAFSGEWGVDETLDALAQTRGLGLIAVGIDNGGEQRIHELSAWDNPRYGKGEGEAYAAFIVEVLKPYIDAHYRSLPDRRHTAIIGSSLGGLSAHYLLFRYPEVFGRAAIFSPSYWFAPQVFDFTATHPLPQDTKIYFYAGGAESAEMLPPLRRMVAQLQQSAAPRPDVFLSIRPEARHNEAAWRAEFPQAVNWLFGTEAAAAALPGAKLP